ncbi:MAG: bifunctional adenosylcobinamide kinase/adenosylcobinamide-phosphate guanylyltransferase [Peptococcales bacterium]|jgi:adenosylcobinamide kinase/adenosylcobinamide-phosphate guanylyltransferase
MSVSLIIGGARSGKSTYGEALAASFSNNVAYIATAEAFDTEMEHRIEMHQAQRPGSWTTYEVPINLYSVISSLSEKHDVFLLDCLTLYISNILLKDLNSDNITWEIQSAKETIITNEIINLTDWVKNNNKHLIVVTNEVGLGIVPANNLSRVYRDIVGRANQLFAKEADQVFLTWAGIPLQIKPNLMRV